MPPPSPPATSPAAGGTVGISPRIPSFARPPAMRSGSGLIAGAGGTGGLLLAPVAAEGGAADVGGGAFILVGGRVVGGGPRRDDSPGGADNPGSVFISGILSDLLASGGGPRMLDESGGRTSRETSGLTSSCGPQRELRFA